MKPLGDWRAELAYIDDLMRTISRVTDPQEMVRVYGDGIDKLFPVDRWIALSRRGLEPPDYRITRSWLWEGIDINPWKQKDRLPLLSGGICGDLIYGNKPVVLEVVTIPTDDPAYDHLKGTRALYAMPQYDGGESLNMPVMLFDDPIKIDHERLPGALWQGNLFGRATLNMILRQELNDAYESLDRELKIVGQMQRSLLPAELPDVPGLKLAAQYETSARAGGDYYDLFPLPDGAWGLFIADVSGHGTPAAVMMAITHALAHAYPGPPLPPSRVLQNLNQRLANRYTGASGQFVTGFYCVYNPKDRSLHYSSAGHNPPRLARRGRIVELNTAGGFPLGITNDAEYTEASMELQANDLLLLYTDGIVEASNPEGEMYGIERLDQLLLSSCHTPSGAIQAINLDVSTFTRDEPLKDDRTLLAALVS